MFSVYRILRTAREAGQKLDDLHRDVRTRAPEGEPFTARDVQTIELADTLMHIRDLLAVIESNADEISRKLRDIADS